MAETVEDVQRLITMARAHRDVGELIAAESLLKQGIDALESALAANKDGGGHGAGSTVSVVGEAAIAVQLADLYGMLGGTLRDQGKYPAATVAYDRGFRLESDPRYAMQSSYNALNRLITRLLLCPNCLADPGLLSTAREFEFVDVGHELADLGAQLRQQVARARAGDFWAAGDLFLASALNGDKQGMMHGLKEFTRLSPPPTAFESYRHIISALARLESPRKAILVEAEKTWAKR